jgi:hypothetical protein
MHVHLDSMTATWAWSHLGGDRAEGTGGKNEQYVLLSVLLSIWWDLKANCERRSFGGALSDVGSAGTSSAIAELRKLYKAVHPVSFWM